MSVWEGKILSTGPFKRIPGFPALFHLTWLDGIPADFHSQILCRLLFLALVLRLGNLVASWDPCYSDSTSAAEIALSILNSHKWVWSSLFCDLAPPTSLEMASFL